MDRSLDDIASAPIVHIDSIAMVTRSYNWDGSLTGWRSPRAVIPQTPGSGPYATGYVHDYKTGWTMRRGARGITMGGSLPRTRRLLNYPLLNTTELPQALDYIRGLLRSHGVSVDINDFVFTRVDLTFDFILDRPLLPLILEISRIPRFANLRLAIDPTRSDWSSVLFLNTQRAVAVYDKSRELVDKHPSCSVPRNVVRLEFRLLNAGACAADGFRGIRSLFDVASQVDVWRKQMRKLIRTAEVSGMFESGLSTGLLDDLAEVICTPNRSVNEIAKVLLRHADLDLILQPVGGVEGLYRHLRPLPVSDTRKSRVRNTYRQLSRKRQDVSLQDSSSRLWSELSDLVEGA